MKVLHSPQTEQLKKNQLSLLLRDQILKIFATETMTWEKNGEMEISKEALEI